MSSGRAHKIKHPQLQQNTGAKKPDAAAWERDGDTGKRMLVQDNTTLERARV